MARILTNSPASRVEVLAGGTDRERQALNFGRQRGDARKRHIVQAVIDLVRQDNDFVLDAEIGNLLQLRFGEDLANRVVYVEMLAFFIRYAV